jgi:transcription regulator MmyB-like protein
MRWWPTCGCPSSNHPNDHGLRQLVGDRQARSTDFADRWRAGRPARHRTTREVVQHPRVGALTLDSDILQAPGSALHVVTYSAEPDTEDADRLDPLRVLGTEAFAH